MKKFLIPIIIIILAIIVASLYFLMPFFIEGMPQIIKIIFGIIFICLTGALIGVLIQRIKEIKGENPDDYSKY